MLQYLIYRVNSQVYRSCDSFLNVLFKLLSFKAQVKALLPDCLNTSEVEILQVCYKPRAAGSTHRLRPHVERGYIPLWWFSSLFYANVPAPLPPTQRPDCTVCHRRSISWLLVRIIRVYFKDLSVLMVILEGFSSLLHMPCDPDAWYCQRDQIWAVNLSDSSVLREQEAVAGKIPKALRTCIWKLSEAPVWSYSCWTPQRTSTSPTRWHLLKSNKL